MAPVQASKLNETGIAIQRHFNILIKDVKEEGMDGAKNKCIDFCNSLPRGEALMLIGSLTKSHHMLELLISAISLGAVKTGQLTLSDMMFGFENNEDDLNALRKRIDAEDYIIPSQEPTNG